MRSELRSAALLGILVALTAGCDSVPGQRPPPVSQPAEVTQKIGPATLRVEYSRPTARGRELFGALVPWDSIWNPGANDATYIELTHDMLVGGHPLPKGKYSIWAIPRPDEWTLIFSRDWDVFHVPYPEGRDALRLRVEPTTGTHMETLAFYFPFATVDQGILHLHWGETIVALALRLAR